MLEDKWRWKWWGHSHYKTNVYLFNSITCSLYFPGFLPQFLWEQIIKIQSHFFLRFFLLPISSASILVLGNKQAQWICRKAFRISVRPTCQSNNVFFSRPIGAHTQILVCKWGPTTTILGLLHKRLNQKFRSVCGTNYILHCPETRSAFQDTYLFFH